MGWTQVTLRLSCTGGGGRKQLSLLETRDGGVGLNANHPTGGGGECEHASSVDMRGGGVETRWGVALGTLRLLRRCGGGANTSSLETRGGGLH